jgi:hypothetical protein
MSDDTPSTSSSNPIVDPSEKDDGSGLVPAPIESKIEEIIDAVPEEQREPVRHLIRDTLFAPKGLILHSLSLTKDA